MLKAIAAEEDDATVLVKCAVRSLRKKLPQLCEALQGQVKPHRRLLLTAIPEHIEGTIQANATSS